MAHSVWGLSGAGTVQRVGMMRRLQRSLSEPVKVDLLGHVRGAEVGGKDIPDGEQVCEGRNRKQSCVLRPSPA